MDKNVSNFLHKTASPSINRHFINIFAPWCCAFFLLFFYYLYIEFPMERSFVKGLDFLTQNKPLEAAQEFDKVLQVYPKYEPVYLNLANFYYQNGRLKESKVKYNFARKLCLINSEIFSKRGLVYAKYRRNLSEGVAFYNDHVLKNYFSSLFYPYEKK